MRFQVQLDSSPAFTVTASSIGECHNAQWRQIWMAQQPQDNYEDRYERSRREALASVDKIKIGLASTETICSDDAQVPTVLETTASQRDLINRIRSERRAKEPKEPPDASPKS